MIATYLYRKKNVIKLSSTLYRISQCLYFRSRMLIVLSTKWILIWGNARNRQGYLKSSTGSMATMLWMLQEKPRRWHSTLHCTALDCTVLYCITLHSTALHKTVLHCTALHCTVQHCTNTALHKTVLYCHAWHCTAQHYTVIHCTAPYCTALHNTAQHCS